VDQRTTWNVRDSDATLVLRQRSEPEDSQGTDLTERIAAQFERPFAVVDLLDPASAREAIEALLRAMPPDGTLNVAGPRESEAPGSYDRSRSLLDQIFTDRGDTAEV
jgi:Circularly permutated YpsA SLOG family